MTDLEMTIKDIAAQIESAIAAADRILVVTHVDPDGDAIGSVTAVGEFLYQRNKRFDLVCDSPVPSRFHYIHMADRVLKSPPAQASYDVLISVDCGDEQRMGQAYAQLPEPHPYIINIDHHVTNTLFGDIDLIDSVATSTAELLYDLFDIMGVQWTSSLALSLLTGLVTDTLGFRTVGVTAHTLKVAGRLMEAGADLGLVTMQALNLKPLSTLKLWRAGLDSMKLEDGLIWTAITNEEREQSGYNAASTGGLVNLFADVDQAAIGAVLMEMGDGSVRVGWRSRPPYRVSEIAAELGGGGHPLASGCTLPGPLAEAEALVVRVSKEAIQQQRDTNVNHR